MDIEIKNKIATIVTGSDFILFGIGEELADASQKTEEDRRQLIKAYDALPVLAGGKPFFVITQNTDALIYKSKIPALFEAAPYAAKEVPGIDQDKQWKAYLNWISSAPSRNSCLFLLGVGILQPQLIRWPFEKTVQIAQHAHLVTVHHNLAFLPEGVGQRGIAVKENAVEFLNAWAKG